MRRSPPNSNHFAAEMKQSRGFLHGVISYREKMADPPCHKTTPSFGPLPWLHEGFLSWLKKHIRHVHGWSFLSLPSKHIQTCFLPWTSIFWWFGCHGFYFPINIGLHSSSQLTNSYFSEGWLNHQPVFEAAWSSNFVAVHSPTPPLINPGLSKFCGARPWLADPHRFLHQAATWDLLTESLHGAKFVYLISMVVSGCLWDVYVYIYIYTYVHTYIYIYTYIHKLILICIYIHKLILICIYIHTYILTHIQTNRQPDIHTYRQTYIHFEFMNRTITAL